MGRQDGLERRNTGRRRAASTGAAALLLGILFGPDPAIAQCNPPAPTSGATVTCSGNPSSFTTAGLSTLTVNIQSGTNFNGPFSASTMNQIDVNSINSNLQSMTFNSIGLLNLSLSGGNINNGITITNGGSANITNSANINQTFTFSGNGSFTLFNTGILNNGLTVTGDGTHAVTSSNFINQTLTFIGNGQDSVSNSGTINPGINKNGGGSLTIDNAAGATINQGVFVTGSSQTTISNFGTIQGAAISLGTGNDLITNNGTINGDSNMGDGNNIVPDAGRPRERQRAAGRRKRCRDRYPAGKSRGSCAPAAATTRCCGPAAWSAASTWGRATTPPRCRT